MTELHDCYILIINSIIREQTHKKILMMWRESSENCTCFFIINSFNYYYSCCGIPRGKDSGMGSAIGGGTNANMSGRTRGKDVVLSKITMVCGVLFAILCLVLGRYMNTF